MKWKRFTGEQIVDLEQTLLTDIANRSEESLAFYMGGDSMKRQGHVTYTVVLVMLMVGHGGIGYYKRIYDNIPKISRQQRLFRETYETVQDALWINPILETIGHQIKEIHTDLNPDPKMGSHNMIKQSIGYIQGMGFVGKTKPESWVAYEVCDRFTK